MQTNLVNILVDDQDKALAFYTGVLGFTKTADVDLGPMRWLTVASPDGVAGVDVVMEKTDFPPAKTYQKARFDAGIPHVGFTSDDIYAELRGLRRRE